MYQGVGIPGITNLGYQWPDRENTMVKLSDDLTNKLITQIAVLEATGKQFGKALGESREQSDNLRDAINQQIVETANMRDTIRDEVLPTIRTIPRMIREGIKDHEKNCPIRNALTERQKEEISQVFELPIIAKEERKLNKRKIVTRERLIAAIITLLVSIASAVTALTASGN